MVPCPDHRLDVDEHFWSDLQTVVPASQMRRENHPTGQLVAVDQADLYRRFSRPKKRRADIDAIVRVPSGLEPSSVSCAGYSFGSLILHITV